MNPAKTEFTLRQNEAIQFVMQMHWTQRRKTTVLPYIVHPIEVAGYLGRLYPDSQDLILSGYLHDVLEDTEATPAMIEMRFGTRVKNLVEGVTAISLGESWREHRQMQLDKLRDTPDLDIVRLKAADMLSNASSIAFDYALFGEETFKKFKGSAEDVRWYYSSAYDIFLQRLSGQPILEFLRLSILEFDP